MLETSTVPVAVPAGATAVPAIVARGLRKDFGNHVVALDTLDLTVPAGAVFALLGPNGSGKTTTVRLLAGILTPSAGTAEVLGLPVGEHLTEVHAGIGVLTETAGAYENLDADENLRFFGRLHGMTESDISARAGHLLAAFDLVAARGRRVKTYSTGMKKRLLLAVAMLHRPRLLFLDEPTSGLDPEAAFAVNRLIRRLSLEEKVTTFLCTHQLRYAEDICDLYGFIAGGRLLAVGSLPDLMARRGGGLRLELRGDGFPAELAAHRGDDGTWRVPVADDLAADLLIRRLQAGGGRVFEARQTRPSLEELYFAYQQEARIGGTPAPGAPAAGPATRGAA